MAKRPRSGSTSSPRGGDHDERTDARERAMMLFYEADSKGVTAADVVAAQVLSPDELTLLLVDGVAADRDRIDQVIAEHAKGWTLQRMPTIDLTILRIATFELFDRPDVPVAVVLNEAVELAKRFSTDDSGRFVNGVLAAVAKVARPT